MVCAEWADEPWCRVWEQAERRAAGGKEEEQAEIGWGLLDWGAYNKGWNVPWGLPRTIGAMLLWAMGFTAAGIAAVPLFLKAGGWHSFSELSDQDKALLTLVDQLASSTFGILGIRVALRGMRDQLPPDFLTLNLRNPLRKPDGWLAWGLLGLAAAPLVIVAASLLSSAVGADEVGGRGTVDAVASMVDLDPVTLVYLLLVTGVQAPVFEELVFRGFLLASLSKVMPVPAAVVLSSVTFGAAHLSPRDFPQLVALGILLGFVYVRSRNLSSTILIHGAWNGSILLLLFVLVCNGVDVVQLLDNL